MRRGYDANLLFSNQGNLVAISTGSDACAEHECGSRPLLSALCNQVDEGNAIVNKLAAGEPVEFPHIADIKRISKLPAELQFIEDHSNPDAPEAFLGYARQDLREYKNELNFPSDSFVKRDINVAGAWDERSFAVRVRGAKYVKALKEFYQAMVDGKVLFAGTILEDRAKVRLSGVILANSQFISDADKAKMKTAQLEYEASLRLQAKDDSASLVAEMRKLSGMPNYHFGLLWVQWADRLWMKREDPREPEVVYGLNPGYDVKADYLGPYTRQQLLDWAKSGFSYKLTNQRQSRAVA